MGEPPFQGHSTSFESEECSCLPISRPQRAGQWNRRYSRGESYLERSLTCPREGLKGTPSSGDKALLCSHWTQRALVRHYRQSPDRGPLLSSYGPGFILLGFQHRQIRDAELDTAMRWWIESRDSLVPPGQGSILDHKDTGSCVAVSIPPE